MDIKRTQPGQVNWNRAAESEPAAKPDAPAPAGLEKAAAGPLHAIGAEFKRADLNTDKWHAILRRSIDALMDSSSQRRGALPAADRQKISDLLAADPIFTMRVFHYWEKNLN
ncbi:MAG: hypothetical protein NTW28_09475 [Candidatus Solibacter sp.]|nr:hypothetical protein [Candidatus Solibacter sp.]